VKKALAIVLCLCVLTQCIARLGVLGWYQLHKDFIAKTLCENRDKPAMKCCGKCYLRKQLKKVEDNDHSKKPLRVDKSEIFVCILPASITTSIPYIPVEASVQHPGVKQLHDCSLPQSVFHPPSV
jgi:hypothetical protein